MRASRARIPVPGIWPRPGVRERAGPRGRRPRGRGAATLPDGPPLPATFPRHPAPSPATPPMRTPRTLLPALALALAAVGCGGPDDPASLTREGYTRLNSGDRAAAQESFEDALAALEPSDPTYLRARLGLAEAKAEDAPGEAKQIVLELSRTHELEEVDFQRVTTVLVGSGHFEEATELVVAGMQAYPESTKMAELRDHVGDAASRSGEGVPDSLKGLGYVGSE